MSTDRRNKQTYQEGSKGLISPYNRPRNQRAETMCIPRSLSNNLIFHPVNKENVNIPSIVTLSVVIKMEFTLVRNFLNCGFWIFAVYFGNIVEHVVVHCIQKPKDGSSCKFVFISVISCMCKLLCYFVPWWSSYMLIRFNFEMS